MNVNLVPVMERIFLSHIRQELEPAYLVIKRMIASAPAFAKPQDLFAHLRNMHAEFWTQFPNAISTIMNWAHQLASVVPQPRQPAVFVEDVKTKIWRNLLCRISLDGWLIMPQPAAVPVSEQVRALIEVIQGQSHGNQVLGILVEVVQDTIHSMFTLLISPQQQQQQQQSAPPLAFGGGGTSGGSLPLPPPPSSQQSASALFDRLLSNPLPPPLVPMPQQQQPMPFAPYQQQQQPTYQPLPMSLPSIPDDDDGISEDELRALRKSSRNVYLPRSDRNGMPIKLKRMGGGDAAVRRRKDKDKDRDHDRESDSHKGSRSRKKKPASGEKTKASSKYEDDDDDEEEDDDGEHRKKKDDDDEEDDDDEDE